MNPLHKIPLHMLLLAGLVGPLQAEDKKEPSAKVAVAEGIAYAGLNVGPRLEAAIASMPAGVGIQVGFVDPKGPSFGRIEEGDVLSRLDDQVLFNADQFRALVRTRKPGDKVKVTLVRAGEPQVVELTLGARPEEKSRPSARAGRGAGELPGGLTVVPGGVIPPEILKQLQDMQAGVIPPPAARSQIPSVDELRARSGANSSSSTHSFSFSFGNGAKSSSHSMASDGEGTVSLEEKDGKKRAVVKDRDGKTLFEGDVTDKAAVEKLPADVRRRLKLVEGKGFTLPGFPLTPQAAPAEEPKKKYDPKQGA
jgi:hypothetical protein